MNPNAEKPRLPESKPGFKPNAKAELNSLPTPELQSFGENIWICDGPNVLDMGVMFTTRMTIVKLANGSLWVNSPVPVSFDILSRITGLGPIRYLVVATPRHVWRLEGWHTLFPEVELWACRTTPMTLKKADLPLAGILDGTPPELWAADLDQHVFKGNPLLSEVLFLHKKSRTLILDDIIQIHPIVKGKPLLNALIKLEGVTAPEGGVGLEIRLGFLNRKLARESLQTVLAWDFDKLIIAHGSCIEKDAKPFVERAFQWLAR